MKRRRDCVSVGVQTDATPALCAEDLCCPITHAVFRDPVVAADGHTYERAAIWLWLWHRGRRTSPVTGDVMSHRRLTRNQLARGRAAEFMAAAAPDQPDLHMETQFYWAVCNHVLDGRTAEVSNSELVECVCTRFSLDPADAGFGLIGVKALTCLVVDPAAKRAFVTSGCAAAVVERLEREHAPKDMCLAGLHLMSRCADFLPPGLHRRVLQAALACHRAHPGVQIFGRVCDVVDCQLGAVQLGGLTDAQLELCWEAATCGGPCRPATAALLESRSPATLLPRLVQLAKAALLRGSYLSALRVLAKVAHRLPEAETKALVDWDLTRALLSTDRNASTEVRLEARVAMAELRLLTHPMEAAAVAAVTSDEDSGIDSGSEFSEVPVILPDRSPSGGWSASDSEDY